MQRPEVPQISLTEAVMFAQESAAIAEAQRHFELNRKLGNTRRMATWSHVLSELDVHRQANAA